MNTNHNYLNLRSTTEESKYAHMEKSFLWEPTDSMSSELTLNWQCLFNVQENRQYANSAGNNAMENSHIF